MSTATRLMTTEERLAMLDDDVDRELIRGELREKPMTMRGNPHTTAMANLSWLLKAWLVGQPRPRGRLHSGDARVRIRRNPDTFVGCDLVYISAEHASTTPTTARLIEGPPLLVIEILSPSDTIEDVSEKVEACLEAGVAVVWEVNPYYQTVTVHRPGAPREIFKEGQDITAEPHLSGFRAPVSEIFAG